MAHAPTHSTEEEERRRRRRRDALAEQVLAPDPAPAPVTPAAPAVSAVPAPRTVETITAELIKQRESGRAGTALEGVDLSTIERRQTQQRARRQLAQEGRTQRRGEIEQRRIEANQRLVAAGQEPRELPSELAARKVAINRARVRKRAADRTALGLPPREEPGAAIKAEAARIAVLEGDLEALPRVRGSLDALEDQARANPKLLEHGEILRATVDGRETLQRFNAVRGDFTAVTIDPITNKIAVDTSNEEALSDESFAESFNTRITSLRRLADDSSLDENSRKQLGFIADGLVSIQQGSSIMGRKEALVQGNRLYSQAAPFIETEGEALTIGEQTLLERLVTRPDGTEFLVQPNGKIDRFTPKLGEVAPSTIQEFFSRGDVSQQQTTFFNVRKQAISDLETEAKRELAQEKARFAARATTAFNTKVAAAGKKEVEAIRAAGPELFGGLETPEAPGTEDIRKRMEEIVQEFLDLRGPATGVAPPVAPAPSPPAQAPPVTTPTAQVPPAPVPAAPAPAAAAAAAAAATAATDFGPESLADIAAENNMTVDEFRRRFLAP